MYGSKAPPVDLQNAIDTSEVIGRWDWDIPNDRLYANATVARLFGVDPAQAERGVPLSQFFEGIHSDDRARTAAVIARSAKAGRSYVQEYRVHSSDGATRWILARGLIALDATGRPHRGTGVLIDVTHARGDAASDADRAGHRIEHPLVEAAEHCLAARRAIRELPDPLLRTMTDMLLLEIGRRLTSLGHPEEPEHRADSA